MEELLHMLSESIWQERGPRALAHAAPEGNVFYGGISLAALACARVALFNMRLDCMAMWQDVQQDTSSFLQRRER